MWQPPNAAAGGCTQHAMQLSIVASSSSFQFGYSAALHRPASERCTLAARRISYSCTSRGYAHIAADRFRAVSVGENLAQTDVSSSGSDDGPISSGSTTTREEFLEGNDAQKTAYVQAEMQRMKRLPSGSTYNTNRLRLLDKMLHLLGKVRTSTEGEELEVLFANLNF